MLTKAKADDPTTEKRRRMRQRAELLREYIMHVYASTGSYNLHVLSPVAKQANFF
jgi:hypothetical protein